VRRFVSLLFFLPVVLGACNSDEPTVPPLPAQVQERPVVKVFGPDDHVHLTCQPNACTPSELRASAVTLAGAAGVRYRLGPAFFTEAQVASASPAPSDDPTVWVVDLTLDADGTKGLETATKEALRQSPAGKVAAVVDGKVVSAPVVQAVIDSGRVELSGFTQQQAQDLADRLNA